MSLVDCQLISNLDISRAMNKQEPARLLRHVLLCMLRGIWYALDATADFAPTLLQSSGLTAFQLETLLYTTAILQSMEKKLILV